MENLQRAIIDKAYIKFCDTYKIELTTNLKGKPVARLLKTLTVGKNKGSDKALSGYYFNSETERDIWVKKQIANVSENIESDRQLKEKKKNAVSSNEFKVGDILYQSWGYDQTNIDFFQITKVLNKTVKIRMISQQVVKETGFMSEYVAPLANDFIGEEMLRPVKVSMWNDNINFIVSNGRYSLNQYTQGDKGLYQSHYA